MKEIEVKVLGVDKKKIIEIISRFGAKKIFEGQIETSFFDFPDARISTAKSILRLRKVGEKSLLTFKTILSQESAKEAEEFEVVVSDMQIMKKILKALGLSETGKILKQRISFSLDSVHFDLDTFENELSYVPTYLEIEAENIDLIYKYAELLGYSIKDCLSWSTEDVINYYATKPK